MPVDNPVETIGAARARLARLAAIRAMLCAVAPALTAIALGLLLEPIGSLTWARYGYSLAPDRANVLSLALVGAGIVVLAAGLVMAFRAYRRADDFVSAAAELDDRLECNQEIVTFATLADPSAPESGRARRTPLFPILWRRAIALFGGLDVRREFRLEVGEPLKRSSIFAGVVALAMVLATLGLVRAPTPANREAAKLRAIAEEIAKTATGPGDTALADKIRAAADALESPELPPEEKKKRIEDAMREANHAAEKRNISEAGKNQAAANPPRRAGRATARARARATLPAPAAVRPRRARDPDRLRAATTPVRAMAAPATTPARTTAATALRKTTRTIGTRAPIRTSSSTTNSPKPKRRSRPLTRRIPGPTASLATTRTRAAPTSPATSPI